MSVNLYEVTQYLNQTLRISEFRDYCPNGLQIEGKKSIQKLGLAVSASLDVIEAAIAEGVDALLVHHGFFWKGEPEVLVSIKGNRIKKLMQNNISLLAYHLPLDAHNKYGNNVELARILEVDLQDNFGSTRPKLGVYGRLKKPINANDFSDLITQKLNRRPTLVVGTDQLIKCVAICSGAAQDFIKDAAEVGVQAYISGEISERTYHEAKELGINFYAAGHHATEKFGVQALGKHLAEKYEINICFLDSNNIA